MDAAYTVRLSPSAPGSPGAYTVSVPVRVASKAVIRNRIRRQIREILRLHIVPEALRSGQRLVLVVKKIPRSSHADLEKEIVLLLKKSGIVVL